MLMPRNWTDLWQKRSSSCKLVILLLSCSSCYCFGAGDLLGDPGAVSGGGKKSKRERKKFGRRKVKNEKKLFFSFLTFLRPNFFLARLDFFPPPLTAPGSPRMGWGRSPSHDGLLAGDIISVVSCCLFYRPIKGYQAMISDLKRVATWPIWADEPKPNMIFEQL